MQTFSKMNDAVCFHSPTNRDLALRLHSGVTSVRVTGDWNPNVLKALKTSGTRLTHLTILCTWCECRQNYCDTPTSIICPKDFPELSSFTVCPGLSAVEVELGQLPLWTNITHLSLGWLTIEDDELKRMAEVCTRLQHLQFVDLVEKVTDEAVLHFAKHLTRLTSLDMEAHLVTDASIIPLLRACPLKSLRLDWQPQATEKSIVALAQHCPNITDVEFNHGSPLTRDALKTLATCAHLRSIVLNLHCDKDDMMVFHRCATLVYHEPHVPKLEQALQRLRWCNAVDADGHLRCRLGKHLDQLVLKYT